MVDQLEQNTSGPVVLLILDGWGVSQYQEGNAIALVSTPNYNNLINNYPNSQLAASGLAVGLTDGERGNSEAGHLNIGAGRVVEQDKIKINQLIEENNRNNNFYSNSALLAAFEHVKTNNSDLHFLGLLSDSQSAHVEQEHVFALLKLAHDNQVRRVYLHLFTDGRDSPQHSAIRFLNQLKEKLYSEQHIASICGRFYAMDRNKRWDRIEQAYNLLVDGQSVFHAENAESAIMQAYNRGETDEFIKPTLITKNNKPLANIKNNDAIIFFNLRSDRARQLTKAFMQPDFCEKNPTCFLRRHELHNLLFVAMTDFGPDLPGIKTAFPNQPLKNTMPFLLKNKKQIYIAETEKYAHMTFFINGGYDRAVAGEQRELISSPLVDSYDAKPAMSTPELTKAVLKSLQDDFDFIAVNFACPDMIGHTGNLEAGIQAVEACDACIEKIVKATLEKKGTIIITADHGNVEEMINIRTKEIDTEHSLNPVPFVLVGEKFKNRTLANGCLADILPTILFLLNLPQPAEVTGKCLINK
jgi:2,3-bisphosphoglycerate-independent phosphoglycerate mutase